MDSDLSHISNASIHSATKKLKCCEEFSDGNRTALTKESSIKVNENISTAVMPEFLIKQ
jgi:hypothetical protein